MKKKYNNSNKISIESAYFQVINQGNTKGHTAGATLPFESTEDSFYGSNYEITFLNLSLAIDLSIVQEIV